MLAVEQGYRLWPDVLEVDQYIIGTQAHLSLWNSAGTGGACRSCTAPCQYQIFRPGQAFIERAVRYSQRLTEGASNRLSGAVAIAATMPWRRDEQPLVQGGTHKPAHAMEDAGGARTGDAGMGGWLNHVRQRESAGSSHPPKLRQTTTGNSPARPNQQPALNPNGLHDIRSGSASLLSRMQEERWHG